MNELNKVDTQCRLYLVEVKYHKWTRAYCLNKVYGTITTNIAEFMNATNNTTRELPITTLVECLRNLLQSWTYKHRNRAQQTSTKLARNAEKWLRNNFVASLKMTVRLHVGLLI